MRSLHVEHQVFAIDGGFTISRGSKTEAHVVTVAISQGDHLGRGECVPYGRYNESIDSVIQQVESLRSEVESGLDRHALLLKIKGGAARNAIDCALWDLEAKLAGARVWELAGIAAPVAATTAYTLSLDTPENMYNAAVKYQNRPLLKLKLAGEGDIERVEAVRRGAPSSDIIVDANEGWTIADYETMVPHMQRLRVSMIEQPLPAHDDSALANLDRPITVCADESCHDTASLANLTGRYDMINIKLDKTGGLTEALALKQQALNAGFEVMVGCMVSSSLAMAPATLLTTGAKVVDLDGPLLLAHDREHALQYDDQSVAPPLPQLWG